MSSNATTFPLEEVTNASASQTVESQCSSASVSEKPDPISIEFTDEALLWQASRGSMDAVGTLFRRHARTVFIVALRILRDEAEAADLRQEVFLYISDRANLFDPNKGSGASWIVQVTYHRAIDRRRYLNSRHHYKSQDLDEQKIPFAQTSMDMVDGRVLRQSFIEKLTEDQRETLELHFFEGYSLREIAGKKGQTLGNVRHHYYRALERLRTHLFPPKRG